MTTLTVHNENKQAQPQTHSKRMRRTRFARIRRRYQLKAFIRQQGTRLSVDDSVIATDLKTMSADAMAAGSPRLKA